jgi:molecular chaperone Hsp33
MSHLVRGLVADGAVRFLTADVTEVADACAKAHTLSPAARTLVGEALAATALMSAHIKGDERVTLQIQAETPPFSFVGEVDAQGAIRARLTPSHVPAGAISGFLFAMRSDGARETYRGVTAIHQQSIVQALGAHLATSDQVDVVLHLKGNFGLLFERLPQAEGHPSLTVDEFQQRFAGAVDVPEDATILDVRPLVWQCRCSLTKVEDALRALGPDELAAMMSEGGTTVTCHFCNTVYALDGKALEALSR